MLFFATAWIKAQITQYRDLRTHRPVTADHCAIPSATYLLIAAFARQ
jgi:hypothetical protein